MLNAVIVELDKLFGGPGRPFSAHHLRSEFDILFYKLKGSVRYRIKFKRSIWDIIKMVMY